MKAIRQTLVISLCIILVQTFLPAVGNQAVSSEETPGFFRYPTTDGEWVVFTSEGDLWKVPLEGGTAVRLTTHQGEEHFAHISPDGKSIAFTGQDDGQDDVFVMPINGGEPRRLTWHPDRDQVIGWTTDGKILFRSSREIPYRGYRIYKLSPDGGMPEVIKLDKAALISFEPDGKRIAFNRYSREFRNWKRYKGGWAQDIWIGNLKKHEFTNITDNPAINDWDGTDAFPMWHTNGKIYFLSDRDGRANIYSMTSDGRGLLRRTTHDEFDVRWPSLGGDVIVYQQGMDIWAYDITEGESRLVNIQLPTDRVQARVKFTDPSRFISSFQLSKEGNRLLFCSRGELFTVPARGEGLIRQLTFNSGTHEKFPYWSADDKKIFFWSDDSGEEQLYSSPASGGDWTSLGTDGRGWHFPPVPSPDGISVAFSNEELELVVMNVESGKSKVVDTASWEIREYSWSADSRFLVYSHIEENWNSTIRLWDASKNETHSVTDDFTNSHSPVFDPEGKYLYFLSDRIANPHLDGQEMTYILDERTLPYVLMLKKGIESPFAPQADPPEEEEEFGDWGKGDKDKKGKKEKGKTKDEEEKEPVKVEIDFDGLSSRIAPVPVKPGNYAGLRAVKNKIFYLAWTNRGMLGRALFEDDDRGVDLHKYNIKKKKHQVIEEGIKGYDISGNGKKLVIWKKDQFTVKGIDDGGGFGKWMKDDDEEDDKTVNLSQWDLHVDVRAEWRQMFRESWRLQRDFFWDPNWHGVDWEAVFNKYAPLASRISTRDELSDLIGEMFAELNCSHTYVWGGDQRRAKSHPTGLLGADLSRHKSGYFLIDRIITGRPWDMKLTSPLAAPGIDVKDGEFIIAINGRQANEVENIYELLSNKASKVVSLTINNRPSPEGAREVIVKPLDSERMLRYWEWVDGRRAYTAEKSDGKIGYIHLTNMGGTGLSQFTAEYLPQHQKSALILDVRYNGGGFVAEMILSHLGRKVFSVGRPRHGTTYRNPQTGFHGYMAAVCNGETGSDGETFTEGFKRLGLGPVIGTRTWGGWVGIRGDKPLVDRGMITQPEFTGWGMDSEYLIEGWGTDPDIEIKEHPAAETIGKDPQLDATIEWLLDKMEKDPKPLPEPPPYPDRSGFSR